MNLHLYVTEALRLVGALAAGLAILAVVWFVSPKQDKGWCNVKSMECYDRLAVRR